MVQHHLIAAHGLASLLRRRLWQAHLDACSPRCNTAHPAPHAISAPLLTQRPMAWCGPAAATASLRPRPHRHGGTPVYSTPTCPHAAPSDERRAKTPAPPRPSCPEKAAPLGLFPVFYRRQHIFSFDTRSMHCPSRLCLCQHHLTSKRRQLTRAASWLALYAGAGGTDAQRLAAIRQVMGRPMQRRLGGFHSQATYRSRSRQRQQPVRILGFRAKNAHRARQGAVAVHLSRMVGCPGAEPVAALLGSTLHSLYTLTSFMAFLNGLSLTLTRLFLHLSSPRFSSGEEAARRSGHGEEAEGDRRIGLAVAGECRRNGPWAAGEEHRHT